MGILLSLVIISILIAFNMFVTDALVRMRRDVKDIHKAVVVDARVPVSAAATTSSALASSNK